MGGGSVGEGAGVSVPSGVVAAAPPAGPAVAVAGMAVARGKTTWGTGCCTEAEVGAGAITMGVGEASAHPLKRDITSVIAIPHRTKCRLIG